VAGSLFAVAAYHLDMAVPFAMLAGLIVLAHMAFVAFAVLGALFALRWPWAAAVHLPTAIWAAYIELSGGICPLTPLENTLRARAGLERYTDDFVARYLLPVLYPDGLTRDAQLVMSVAVVVVNVALYSFVYSRRTSRRR
jgi:hypothetical protein